MKENLTDCVISQTNKYGWSWMDCNYITGLRSELHINTLQDLFPLLHRYVENPYLSSSSSAFRLSAIMMLLPCVKIRHGISPTLTPPPPPQRGLPWKTEWGKQQVCCRSILNLSFRNLDIFDLQKGMAIAHIQAHRKNVSFQRSFLSSISLP